jgi:fermentation-respiration switch protein FrsA (DUF1100 family)
MDMVGLPDVGEIFQSAGITALMFDPRNTGRSDGFPRNEIDPFNQVGDLSDALTFLSAQSSVDPSQMGFWGFSFGGTASLCAASLDKRAKFVIAVAPLTDFDFEEGYQPKVLAKAIKDRESQLRGNAPYSIAMVNKKGENSVGFGHGLDKERYAKIVQDGTPIAPNHVNRITLQSYYKVTMWQPFSLWRFLPPTEVMFVIPALDKMSYPHMQKRYFEELTSPKRLYVEACAGHEDILSGEHLKLVVARQIDFITDTLQGGL